jgi:hypothetical protein
MNLNDIENKLKDIWANNKLLLVLVAIPLLILKFRSVIIDLLVKDSRKIVDETTKKDDALKTEQTVANTKADQIIVDANKAKKDSDSQTVNEDWNKK